MPAGQTIDVVRLYAIAIAGVICGREHSTRSPHIELGSVANTTTELWGYSAVQALRRGEHRTMTTSIGDRTRPARFASRPHRSLSELAARFPDHTHYMDGVELYTFSPDGAVMW